MDGMVDHDLCEFELTDELVATPCVARACTIWKCPKHRARQNALGERQDALHVELLDLRGVARSMRSSVSSSRSFSAWRS